MYAYLECPIIATKYSTMDFYANNTSQNAKHYMINPAFKEVAVSTIAHDLFPNNFATYKFFTETRDTTQADAGYVLEYEKVECGDAPLGVENVYATAFFLGLSLRSYFCILKDEQIYLYVDDFSDSLYLIDAERGILAHRYRGSKYVPTSYGRLFPLELMNEECGEWVGAKCDLEQLKQAYYLILSKFIFEPCHIINMAASVSQAIECQHNNTLNNQNIDCFSENYKDEWHEYLCNRTLGIIVNNYFGTQYLYNKTYPDHVTTIENAIVERLTQEPKPLVYEDTEAEFLLDQVIAIGNAIEEQLKQEPKPTVYEDTEALDRHAAAIESGNITIGLPERGLAGGLDDDET